jgi:hypothetical protein
MGKEKIRLNKTHRKNYPSQPTEPEGWKMQKHATGRTTQENPYQMVKTVPIDRPELGNANTISS